MTAETFQTEVENAVPALLDMARLLTNRAISDKCKFILTDFESRECDFPKRRHLMIQKNNKKTPLTFRECMPVLERLYPELYDVNLYIHKAFRKLTIIDIRYFLKSSFDEDYRATVIHHPPMLHCKVEMPPWLFGEQKKFDINWQHKPLLTKWKTFWAWQKVKKNERKRRRLANDLKR